MLQEPGLNEEYNRSCGGTEPSDSSANSSSVYHLNSSTNMSETVQPDKSMLKNETTRALQTHNQKQVDGLTMKSMDHAEINKWQNSISMCKSHMQL